MNPDDLQLRVERAYAAAEAIRESDMSKMPARPIGGSGLIGFHQDFTEGIPEAELHNGAYLLIHNIWNLRDHLINWAKRNDKDDRMVDAVVRGSRSLKVIADLSNGDKHGNPLSRPRTKWQPKLVGLTRNLHLRTQSIKGSRVGITFNASGELKILGDGSAEAIITADVVADDGEKLGDLHEIQQEAMRDWEGLLVEWGLMAATDEAT